MSLELAFVADPLDSFRIYKDSTYVMMVEAARRGHRLWAMEQGDLAVIDGQVVGRATALSLRSPSGPQAHDWYEASEAQVRPLASFDGIVMRKDPPFDMEYVYSTYLLEMAERQGARVFNRPRTIRDQNEKFGITEFPAFTAPTIVTRDARHLADFLAREQHVVLKPLDGMGGSSIFVVRAGDPNFNVIVETLTAHGTRMIMAQRYLPEIAEGDKRVLLIAGVPVPYCLARIPKAGESRGNLAAGGTGVARALTARDREIADTLGPVLAARGLLLVGLDVIGSHLTEINVTSPTCFQEITQQTGLSVAALFIDALEAAIRSTHP